MPTPVPPDVIVSHEAADADCHEQSGAAVMLIAPELLVKPAEAEAGESDTAQVIPVCENVTHVPAIVIIAPRVEPVVFAAADHVTVPEPVPLAPDVIATQLALELAVHGQPAEVETESVPESPAGFGETKETPTWYEQLRPA